MAEKIIVELQSKLQQTKSTFAQLKEKGGFKGNSQAEQEVNNLIKELDSFSSKTDLTSKNLTRIGAVYKQLSDILLKVAYATGNTSKEFKTLEKQLKRQLDTVEKLREKQGKFLKQGRINDDTGKYELFTTYQKDVIEKAKIKNQKGVQIKGVETFFKRFDENGEPISNKFQNPEKAKEIYNKLKETEIKNATSLAELNQEIDQYKEAITNTRAELSKQSTQETSPEAGKIVDTKVDVDRLIDDEKETRRKLNDKNNDTNPIEGLKQTTDKQSSTLGRAFKQFSLYAIALRTIKQAAREAISTIKELDKSLTEQAMVNGLTRQQTYKLVGEYQNLALQCGATTKEIAGVATEYMKQGKTIQESLTLTQAAVSAAKVARVSVGDSINYLTTALNGFRLSAEDAMKVSDKFAAVAASSATDYDELAIALSKVASQANLAGMSIDYTAALLAKGLETTREAPETIGTALKTIIARMRELSDYGETLGGDTDINNVESQLAYVGIALRDNNGELRSTEEVLDQLGRKWDTLNSNQQAAVAKALAGTRQQSRLIAMMSDYERVIELQQIAERSSGTTLSQMSTYLEGMDAALNRVSVTWEKIVTNLVDNEFIISLVNTFSSVLDIIGRIFSTTSTIVPVMALMVMYATSLGAKKLEEYKIAKLQQKIDKEKRINDLKDFIITRKETLEKEKQLKLDIIAKEVENNKLTEAEAKAKIAEVNAQYTKDMIDNDEQILVAQGQLNLLQNESVNQTADIVSNIGIANGGILSAITGSNIWLGVMTALGFAIKILPPLIKAVRVEMKKNTAEGFKGALVAMAKTASESLGVPGLIMAAALLAIAGIAGVTNLIKSSTGNTSKTADEVNSLSNQIYQLETKASAINTITKSYDDLNKQLIKTNANQEEMNNLLDQAADKLDEEQKNAYKALQTNEDRLKYLKSIQQQSEEQADTLRKQQINSISNASTSTKNALLDENITDSNILTAQAAIYANNNNELYKYINSLTEAKAGVEDLAEVLLSELTPAQALAFAEQPELISKLVDSLNSLSTTYTSLSDSSVKGTAAEVLTSDDYSIVDKVNAYKDAIASLDNEMAKILETTYSDIAVFAEFDTTVLDFINKKNFTTDGINAVGKAIQELGYDTTQSTQMIQLLFAAINSGSSIQDAIYNIFGRGLSDSDYNNILKAYSDAIGTGVLNMGQNIQSLKNTINSFYETAMKWNDLTDTEKTSFMVDNAELFKGQEGAQLLKAIESQDYNLIYAALSDKDGTLYKKVQQQIKDIDEEIKLEYAKLEEERDYAYIKYLEDQKKVLKDSENLYAASLENRLEQEQKYLDEYKSYLEDQKEALTDSLDKRKEAYSDYFETVNQEAETEDFQTQEKTLIANISKLATSGNANAVNQSAQLEQQLKDLEKERLQTLRQQAQDNLMNSIEDEVSEINEKFDKLLNSQSALLAAMTQDLSNPTKFLSNIIANKATQEGLTMTGLQSYVKDIQSIYSPLLGNDVLSKISVREEGNSLILNVNGEEINLSNSDQQSIYEAIMLALKQVGLK